MLLFFFPVHAETWLKAVVATVSVIATWKHVGVVVDVKVVAAKNRGGALRVDRGLNEVGARVLQVF